MFWGALLVPLGRFGAQFSIEPDPTGVSKSRLGHQVGKIMKTRVSKNETRTNIKTYLKNVAKMRASETKLSVSHNTSCQIAIFGVS